MPEYYTMTDLLQNSGIRSDPQHSALDPSTGKQVTAAVESVKMFAKGDFPPNDLLSESISSTQVGLAPEMENLLLTSHRQTLIRERSDSLDLSVHAQVLVEDTQRLLDIANRWAPGAHFSLAHSHRFIQQKNAGEEIQHVWTLSQQNKRIEAEEKKQEEERHPEKKGEIKQQPKDLRDEDMLTLSRKLIFVLIRSHAFRKTLLQFIDLMQDIFWGKDTRRKEAEKKADERNAQKIDRAVLKDQVDRSDNPNTRTLLSVNLIKAQQDVERAKIERKYDPHQEITWEEKQEYNVRARRLISRLAGEPAHHHALARLFVVSTKFTEFLDLLIGQPMTDGKDAKDTAAWHDLRTMIERFIGAEQLQRYLFELKRRYLVLVTEPRAISVVRQCKMIVVEGLRDAETLNDPQKIKSLDDCIEKMRSLALDQRFSDSIHICLDICKDIVRGIRRDPLTLELDAALKNFGRHMAFNSKHKFSAGIFAESLEHLKNVMLPVVMKQFEYIPVKKVEVFTPMYEVALSEMVFCLPSMMPSQIQVRVHTDIGFNTLELAAQDTSMTVEVEMNNLNVDLKDILFEYHWKTFPKIQDKGKIDVRMPRKGMYILLTFVVQSRDGYKASVVMKSASVKIDKLKLHVSQAERHKLLDKAISKLLKTAIRVAIQDQMEEYLSSLGKYIAERMTRVFASIHATQGGSLATRRM
ncbi:hypothetical protein PROFUN_05317 [Planoprotostelium fungivorum]|uniref:HAM1-like N-terminal domain-containing protein n=1 Tax=Planoprotostelium fungivorum TaxID=1890364 RepID=A0A2P6NR93_9EUKA|nr:hypothetical protein PROFUN_05317 [Planoprotostelium fungivorum]